MPLGSGFVDLFDEGINGHLHQGFYAHPSGRERED